MRSINRFILGVTGKYCSGKNTLTKILKKQGFLEIDVDRIGHEILEKHPQKEQVVEHFGSSILDEHGKIDRKLLGNIVFKDTQSLESLEHILHPGMIDVVKKEVEDTEAFFVINAAILFKMGLYRLCDLVICVHSPFCKRLRRAVARDKLSVMTVFLRLLSQKKLNPKLNVNEVDIYYVENKKNADLLQEQALNILKEKGIIS